MVHVQCVEAHKVIVLQQPGEEGTVEVEGAEANVGFHDGKEDKLFLPWQPNTRDQKHSQRPSHLLGTC